MCNADFAARCPCCPQPHLSKMGNDVMISAASSSTTIAAATCRMQAWKTGAVRLVTGLRRCCNKQPISRREETV